MKIPTFSTFLLAFAFAGGLGCGSGGDAGTGGSPGSGGALGSGGTGGSGGTTYDAAVPVDTNPDVPIDQNPGFPDTSVPIEAAAPVDWGPNAPFLDCTGLTAAQCHNRIINPPVLPDSVLPQDPGANPAIGYPACGSL